MNGRQLPLFATPTVTGTGSAATSGVVIVAKFEMPLSCRS